MCVCVCVCVCVCITYTECENAYNIEKPTRVIPGSVMQVTLICKHRRPETKLENAWESLKVNDVHTHAHTLA